MVSDMLGNSTRVYIFCHLWNQLNALFFQHWESCGRFVHSLRVLGMMSRPWLHVRSKMQEEGALPWETPSPGGTDKQRKHRPSALAMRLVWGAGGGNQRGPCIVS